MRILFSTQTIKKKSNYVSGYLLVEKRLKWDKNEHTGWKRYHPEGPGQT